MTQLDVSSTCVRTDVNFRPTSRNRLRVRIHEPRRRQKMEVDCCRYPPDVGRSSGSYAPPQLTELCLVADNFRCHLQILKMRRGISNKRNIEQTEEFAARL